MKFSITLSATIEASSVADAAMQADRIKSLLQNPMMGMMLKSSGVRMMGSPSVGKPEEKK